MSQTQSVVTAVTPSRNAVAPGATTSSNNGGYVVAPCVAPGGQARSTRNKGEALRLVTIGGKHRSAEGDSTRPTNALLDWFQGEVRAAVTSPVPVVTEVRRRTLRPTTKKTAGSAACEPARSNH